ncbi:hypothetical protein ACFLW2_04135 [Chloroflexota bacterium]
MVNRSQETNILANPHFLRIALIMATCATYYYLDVFAGLVGWTSIESAFSNYHDFHGLVFFVPVVYAAYTFGLIGSLLVALVTMVILYPYAIIVTDYSHALYRPTAFGIILSAVGAAIALLQRIDQQRNKYMKELECLNDISKTPEASYSIENFLLSAVETISQAIQYPERTSIRIIVRGKAYENKDFIETPENIKKTLVFGGSVLGSIEVYFNYKCRSLKEHNTLIETFADRISVAVQKIELEQSLKFSTER